MNLTQNSQTEIYGFQTNRIFEGDATAKMREIPDDAVDLIVTDPPYLINYRDRSGRTIANDANPEAVLPAISEMHRVLRNDRYALIFCGYSAINQFSASWTDAGFRTVGQIIWHKSYASGSWHLERRHESAWLLANGSPRKPRNPVSDVMDWCYSGNRIHPTEKSVEILKPLIEAYSFEDDIVLDPFLGSGSTCVAASMLDRRYLGIELDKSYCELAERRLANVSRSRK